MEILAPSPSHSWLCPGAQLTAISMPPAAGPQDAQQSIWQIWLWAGGLVLGHCSQQATWAPAPAPHARRRACRSHGSCMGVGQLHAGDRSSRDCWVTTQLPSASVDCVALPQKQQLARGMGLAINTSLGGIISL